MVGVGLGEGRVLLECFSGCSGFGAGLHGDSRRRRGDFFLDAKRAKISVRLFVFNSETFALITA